MGRYVRYGVKLAIFSIGGYSLLVALGKLRFGWFETLSWNGFFTIISISAVVWGCVLILLHRWESQFQEHDYEKFMDDLNTRLETEKSPCCAAPMVLDLHAQKENERTYHICCSQCGTKCDWFKIVV